jgi:hypothetical protein
VVLTWDEPELALARNGACYIILICRRILAQAATRISASAVNGAHNLKCIILNISSSKTHRRASIAGKL